MMSAARRLLSRPDFTALIGALVVWGFFAVMAGAPFRTVDATAAFLNASAPLGILAVAVALLMIGGEFDLSVGSMIGLAGMILMVLTVELGWSLLPAVLATFVVAATLGAGNGLLVVKTGLPSFIVTLGTLFVFRGLTIAGSRALAGRTQIGGLDEVEGFESARILFAATLVGPFRVSVLWWLALAAVGVWVLHRTRWGNWILGTGGSARAARNMGVPVTRVKLGLFVATALAGALVAVMQAVRFTGADALRGELEEFRAIIAVVIGGTLLTGGYGSVTGAVVGALIFGMVRQGIVIAGVDADWFQVFLGGVLVAAVVLNDYIRRRAVRA